MTIRRVLVVTAQVLIALAVIVYGGAYFLTNMPGVSHVGPQPPATAEEQALAQTLRRHVEALAASERNLAHYDGLEAAARYIETTLRSYGYEVGAQAYEVEGKSVRNIDATIEPAGARPNPDVWVIGANYDSAVGSPGANANASGTAAVLELARLLSGLKGQTIRRIRFVLFVNSEPPYFQTAAMGSLRYAQSLAERKERVLGMFSLGSLGYYSSAPGSQRHLPPTGLVISHQGDFVGFWALLGSRRFLRETVKQFRVNAAIPSAGGFASRLFPGIDRSDHWSFAEQGFPAVWISDTGGYRYPHDHKPTDTPERLDYEQLARVVKGLERTISIAVR